MLDWSQCRAVEQTPGKVSGAWVFKGTRVPVRALFENLEDGARLDDFLTWFPGVTREQAETVLRHAEDSLEVALIPATSRSSADEDSVRSRHTNSIASPRNRATATPKTNQTVGTTRELDWRSWFLMGLIVLKSG